MLYREFVEEGRSQGKKDFELVLVCAGIFDDCKGDNDKSSDTSNNRRRQCVKVVEEKVEVDTK